MYHAGLPCNTNAVGTEQPMGAGCQVCGPAFPDRCDAPALYLDLMKRCLINVIYGDVEGWASFQASGADAAKRLEGRDWPRLAHTMIGLARLDNLQACVEDVLAHGVPGDLIETGVWRGGATIFLRALLKAHGVTDRYVWVADSFAGLPVPRPAFYPQDAGSTLHQFPELAVSLREVQANFARYGLLDNQVRFLQGWFRDTLPAAPIGQLAILRLDGDLYESTRDALVHLYPKLSPGGYIILDDYGAVPACRQAVHDYRTAHGIAEPLQAIDWTAIY